MLNAMDGPDVSERERLRRQLGARLASDSDLNAFCIDYFPDTFQRFSRGMERKEKENLLLLLAEPTELERCLGRLSEIPGRLISNAAPESAPTWPVQSAPSSRISEEGPQPPRASFDVRWYVARTQEEQRARDALKYRRPVILYGPEHYGKTWLFHSVLALARRSGLRVATISLLLFDRGTLSTVEAFLGKLALRLCQELGLPTDEAERLFADARRRGGPLVAMNDLLEYLVLPAVPEGLVLALDDLDLIAGQPYQDELFGMLRAWADTSEGAIGRLRLVLCISTAPALLVADANRSPFNVGDVLVLGDLSAEQVRELVRRHNHLPPPKDEELDRLRALVGGHPYLLRIALYEACVQGMPIGALLLQAEQDGGVFAGYLERLRQRLDRQPELLVALSRIAIDGKPPLPAVRNRLERAGLICRDGITKAYALRHRLYARLLGS